MIFELLIGTWALNSISKDVCECIDIFDEEQEKLRDDIDEIQKEIQRLKNK